MLSFSLLLSLLLMHMLSLSLSLLLLLLLLLLPLLLLWLLLLLSHLLGCQRAALFRLSHTWFSIDYHVRLFLLSGVVYRPQLSTRQSEASRVSLSALLARALKRCTHHTGAGVILVIAGADRVLAGYQSVTVW